jgi:hypothetical protein
MRSLVQRFSIDHVLIDLPSVDREDDGGLLLSHRTFFLTDAHYSTDKDDEHGGRIIGTDWFPVDDPDMQQSDRLQWSVPSSDGPSLVHPLMVAERDSSSGTPLLPVRTITELCRPDNSAGEPLVKGGLYAMNLQLLAVETDCSPSRPVLVELDKFLEGSH